MKIIECHTDSDLGEAGAREVLSALRRRRNPVLGLATGSSPVPIYRALAGREDFSGVRGFALDEYVGLGSNDPQSYLSVIHREIVGPLGMDPSLVLVPDGLTLDASAEADRYETAIRDAGGVDVQILGLGSNGHLAFNEPPSSFTSGTREVALSDSTRHDNARFFPHFDDVPTHAITQGLATIMSARVLVLVASGVRKAGAVARALQGPATEDFPASILQEHPHVTVILANGAGHLLKNAQDSSQPAAGGVLVPGGRRPPRRFE